MLNLFVHTFSQGLQAFMPVAVALLWFDRHGNTAAASAIRRGLLLSLPTTVLAAWIFQQSANQALVVTLFGAVVAIIAALGLRETWRGESHRSLASTGAGRLLVTCATAFVVVRQSQELSSVLWVVVVELRSISAMTVILASLLLATTSVVVWMWAGYRVSVGGLQSGTRLFAFGFLVQVLLFSIHEASEAGVLPWSETVHAATEMYGPDGRYGVYLSALIFLAAFAVLTSTSRGSDRSHPVGLIR